MKYLKIYIVLSFVFILLNCSESTGDIYLPYGTSQEFQFRHSDINILGRIDASVPVQKSVYFLNEGAEVSFYIKGTDGIKDSMARNRLENKGDFNIEIPVKSIELKDGYNKVRIVIIDSTGAMHRETISFSWNPAPVTLPLDLSDISGVTKIQEIGQVVNGIFDVDPVNNCIKCREPVVMDALLLLGSPYGSQEATYSVRFYEDNSTHFLGLSEFFAGHEAAEPPIGIKPGWSSAGLATIRPNAEKSAQIWLAWGDLLNSPKKWVVKTTPAVKFDIKYGEVYRVRHQVLFENGINRARFWIWRIEEDEPENWLCEENDDIIPADKIKFNRASFGLFQFHGKPTEWFDIKIIPVNKRGVIFYLSVNTF